MLSLELNLPVGTYVRHSEFHEAPDSKPSSEASPDHRHLQYIHTRISGEDGLGQAVIEPYHAPLLPLAPNTTPRKPPILQLKVTGNKKNGFSAGRTNGGWLRRDVAQKSPFVQPVSMPEVDKLPKSSPLVNLDACKIPSTSVRSVWSKTPSTPLTGRTSNKVNEHHFPSLGLTTDEAQPARNNLAALAVEPLANDVTGSSRGPERQLGPVEDSNKWHLVVSQKKAKKAQRESKRKAKKVSDSSEETLSPTAEQEAGCKNRTHKSHQGLLNGSIDCNVANAMDELTPRSTADCIVELIADDKDGVRAKAADEQATIVGTAFKPFSIPLPRTDHGKHDRWTRFTRIFAVDQFTIPLLQSSEGCLHGSACRFESQGILDCPFHKPRK